MLNLFLMKLNQSGIFLMKKISFVTAFFWFVTYAFYSQPTYSMNDEIEPHEKKRKMEVQTVSSAQPETGDDVFIIESEKLLKDFKFECKDTHGYLGTLGLDGQISQPMQQKPLPVMKGITEDFCTILLETSTSKGTGFIGYIDDMDLSSQNNKMHYPPYNYSGPIIPFLFTNKHVIQKKVDGNFVELADQDHLMMTLRFIKYSDNYSDSGDFDFKIAQIKVTYHHLKPYIIYGDENIDIAAICLYYLFDSLHTQSKLKGFLPYYYGIDMGLAFKVNLKGLETGSDICLFGYPQGIFDEINYLPIGRFGHCSCNPQVSKERFYVDIASFPGQSGSPVFFKKTNLIEVNGPSSFLYGMQTNLVGIFTGLLLDSFTGSPIHLGEVIKIDRLKHLIRKYWESKGITVSSSSACNQQ